MAIFVAFVTGGRNCCSYNTSSIALRLRYARASRSFCGSCSPQRMSCLRCRSTSDVRWLISKVENGWRPQLGLWGRQKRLTIASSTDRNPAMAHSIVITQSIYYSFVAVAYNTIGFITHVIFYWRPMLPHQRATPHAVVSRISWTVGAILTNLSRDVQYVSDRVTGELHRREWINSPSTSL